jgi:hypothetical protein
MATTPLSAERNTSTRNSGLPRTTSPAASVYTSGSGYSNSTDPLNGGTLSPESQAIRDARLRAVADAASGDFQWPTTWPPGGYPTGGGGGGGGGSAPPPDYSAWGGWAAATRPGTLTAKPLDLPEYQQYAPRPWDTTQYDTARQGVTSGIADARNIGNTAFDRQLAEYQAMRNPYTQGPQTSNPGVDPRLLASMQAWNGAGSYDAAQVNQEGVQADKAMQSVYNLLASGQDQYQQGLIRSTAGDRMQLDQRLGGEERMLNLGINMAQARAKAEYDKEVWTLGKEAADRNYEARMAEATANWTRSNTVDDTNVATANTWNQNVLNTILSMISSGGTGIPASGNYLSDMITMPRSA